MYPGPETPVLFHMIIPPYSEQSKRIMTTYEWSADGHSNFPETIIDPDYIVVGSLDPYHYMLLLKKINFNN